MKKTVALILIALNLTTSTYALNTDTKLHNYYVKLREEEKRIEDIIKKENQSEILYQDLKNITASASMPKDDLNQNLSQNKKQASLNLTKKELQGNDNLCALYCTSALFNYKDITNKSAEELLVLAQKETIYVDNKLVSWDIRSGGTHITQLRNLARYYDADFETIMITNKTWINKTRKYIDNKIPVMIFISNQDISHAVLITGYNNETKSFTVYNPWYDYDTSLSYDGDYIDHTNNTYKAEIALFLMQNEEFKQLKEQLMKINNIPANK